MSHTLLALGLSQVLASVLSPLTVLEYRLLKCVWVVSLLDPTALERKHADSYRRKGLWGSAGGVARPVPLCL